MDQLRLLTAFLLIPILVAFTQIPEAISYDKQGFLKVIKVIDGDTFWVADGSEKGIKVRLIGVDAPESRNVFKKKKGYYGEEAKQYVTELLEGKSVRLELDVSEFDQFGRTLAYVFLEDGSFLNAKLLKEGYAVVMTVPPNVKFADEFIVLQREAREKGVGLWGIEVE